MDRLRFVPVFQISVIGEGGKNTTGKILHFGNQIEKHFGGTSVKEATRAGTDQKGAQNQAPSAIRTSNGSSSTPTKPQVKHGQTR